MALGNTEEIGARLSLKDRRQFSAEADKAAHDVQNIGDKAEKAGKRARSSATGFGVLGKGIGALAKVAKVGILGLGAVVGAIGVIGTKEMMDAQKVTAQTNAVLKSTHGIAGVTADSIGKLSGSIMAYSGIDDEAVQSGANLLLTFTNIRNHVGKGNDVFDQATKSIVDMSTAMHEDMSASAIRVGKALQDPIKGATALRRVGVMLTDQQQKQIKTLVESGKTMEAQKMILRELNTEFGGSAKAYGRTLPGLISRTKEQLKNVAGDVMKPLLMLISGPLDGILRWADKAQPALEHAGEAASRFFGNIGAQFPNLIAAVKDGDKVGIGEVVDNMFGNTGKLIPIVSRLVDVVKDLMTIGREWGPVFLDVAKIVGVVVVGALVAATKVIGWLADNAKWLRPIVFALVTGFLAYATTMKIVNTVTAAYNAILAANPIGLVVAALAALVLGFMYAWKNSETFRNVVTGAFNAVKGAASAVWHFIADNWPLLLAILTGPFGLAVYAIQKNWDSIKAAVKGTINAILHGVEWGINKTIDLINGFLDGIDKAAGPWVNFGEIGHVKVPRLHTGGTVTEAGLANIQPREEVVYLPDGASVVPLGTAGPQGGGTGPVTLQVVLDRRVLAEAVWDGTRDKAARR